jgi:hypothetical protein
MGEDLHIVRQIFENKYGDYEFFEVGLKQKLKMNKMQIKKRVFGYGV